MTLYELFHQVLEMNKITSFVIVMVILIRLLLKKAPKVYSYTLWGIVLFRMLCPVSFTSDFSLLNFADELVKETEHTIYISKEIAVFDTTTTEALDTSSGNEVKQSEMKEGNSTPSVNYEEIAKKSYLTEKVLGIIWISGIAIILSYNFIQVFLLKRRLIGSFAIEKTTYLADHIESPFVMGLFRAKIYIPSSLSESEREYIVLHEKHHIKRGDHIVKFVAFMALCIHWFNPLVWISFMLFNRDMEMSCDEAVISKIKKDIRAEYSTSLLRFATNKKNPVSFSLAFGESDTKGRVKNVMKYKKPIVLVTVFQLSS